MIKNHVHAQYINLEDNVPFQRVYKNRRLFLSSYARMKDARLDHAIDYKNCMVVRDNNLEEYRKLH